MREETRMATSEAARKLSNLLASIAIYDNAFAKMLNKISKKSPRSLASVDELPLNFFRIFF